MQQLIYSNSVASGPALFFAKSAIFLLYLRIFSVHEKMRYCIWSGLVFTFLICWSAVLFGTLWCAPRAGEKWGIESIEGRCEKDVIFGVVFGVLAVVLDLYIFFLPIPIVLNLQMSQKRRLSVLAIFGTAFL